MRVEIRFALLLTVLMACGDDQASKPTAPCGAMLNATGQSLGRELACKEGDPTIGLFAPAQSANPLRAGDDTVLMMRIVAGHDYPISDATVEVVVVNGSAVGTPMMLKTDSRGVADVAIAVGDKAGALVASVVVSGTDYRGAGYVQTILERPDIAALEINAPTTLKVGMAETVRVETFADDELTKAPEAGTRVRLCFDEQRGVTMPALAATDDAGVAELRVIARSVAPDAGTVDLVACPGTIPCPETPPYAEKCDVAKVTIEPATPRVERIRTIAPSASVLRNAEVEVDVVAYSKADYSRTSPEGTALQLCPDLASSSIESAILLTDEHGTTSASFTPHVAKTVCLNVCPIDIDCPATKDVRCGESCVSVVDPRAARVALELDEVALAVGQSTVARAIAFANDAETAVAEDRTAILLCLDERLTAKTSRLVVAGGKGVAKGSITAVEAGTAILRACPADVGCGAAMSDRCDTRTVVITEDEDAGR